MNLTLLLDLDDTLLGNNTDVFIPSYLKAFSREAAPYIEPKKFLDELLAATRAMVRNRRPDQTLEKVFNKAFFTAVGLQLEDLQGLFVHFYADVFPTLQPLTQHRPEALQLVRRAFELGCRIVVATNPVFPYTANEQRLEWAGMSPKEQPFDLVACYETFHFTKPSPLFFAESLAKLGWPEGPILVVGDSLENDILAASQIGLSTFWVTPDGSKPPEGNQNAPSASGKSLDEVFPWLETLSLTDLEPDLTSPPAMLAVLLSTPAALDSICSQLTGGGWTRQPRSEEWSITEIICHLRDVEREVNLPRIHKMLAEANPIIEGMDTDLWAKERQYSQQDGLKALQQFTTGRMELISRLEQMAPENWQRTGRHTILGPTKLAEIVNIIASHDRLHIKQVLENLKT